MILILLKSVSEEPGHSPWHQNKRGVSQMSFKTLCPGTGWPPYFEVEEKEKQTAKVIENIILLLRTARGWTLPIWLLLFISGFISIWGEDMGTRSWGLNHGSETLLDLETSHLGTPVMLSRGFPQSLLLYTISTWFDDVNLCLLSNIVFLYLPAHSINLLLAVCCPTISSWASLLWQAQILYCRGKHVLDPMRK